MLGNKNSKDGDGLANSTWQLSRRTECKLSANLDPKEDIDRHCQLISQSFQFFELVHISLLFQASRSTCHPTTGGAFLCAWSRSSNTRVFKNPFLVTWYGHAKT